MIRAVLPVATAAMLAVPAMAQRDFAPDKVDKSAIGTRFKLAEEAVDTSDMRIMQKKIIRCTASGDRNLAREILQKSDPVTIDHAQLSIEYGAMMDKMNFDRCMARAMPRNARMMRIRFLNSVVRNALAEEIYLYENKEPLVIAEGDLEYLDNRYYAGGRPYAMAEVPARLADCIVYRAPEKSHEFVGTNPTSSGEREAAEALSQTVNECLPGGDGEVSLSLAQLRAYVADGLWSRSYYGGTRNGEVAAEGGEIE